VAPLFSELEAGGWRGFSVEIAKNLKTATRSLTGWGLTGGVFTNRPATDVNFRIAATGTETADTRGRVQICLDAGEQENEDMESKEKVAALEAELATANETIKALRATQEGDKGEAATLEARMQETTKDLAAANIALSETKAKLGAAENELARVNKELGKQEQARKEAEIKLEAEEARSLRERVVKLSEEAIDRGVSAKHFEGQAEDPVTWFRKRFVSLEAMEQFVSALPTVQESSTRSGNAPDEKAAPVPEETAAKLTRLGLDPKYVGKTSENEIIALRHADKNK
jgi:hypothetical protein